MKHGGRTHILGAIALVALAGCGGGTDGTGAIPPTGTVTSSGVMTKGSVILNGTRFDPAGATVFDDRGRGAAQLDSGMTVKLRGRSDDGVTGVADLIDVENEARGVVESVEPDADPRRLKVAGLVVLVDAGTVYANVPGFGALSPGARVEVHGLRDTSGALHATRVEAVAAQEGQDEMRGAVAGLATAADRFLLNGTIAVNYAGAVFLPAGASEVALANGSPVEVRGTLNGNVFTATRIDVEDLEDSDFRGRANEKQDVEGFIGGFSAHPGVFQVNGRSVQTTSTTLFLSGSAADLANDVQVEVDGVLDAQQVLVATRVRFDRTRVIVQAMATAVDVPLRTLTVLAQPVRVNDLTRIIARTVAGPPSDSLGDVSANTDCVEARGHMEGATFVAEWIRELNQCGADVVQARVTGKDEPNNLLSFFGGLAAAMPANASYRDGNDMPVTRAAFFALVNLAGADNPATLLKLRGTFAGGTFTTAEAEIKN